MANTTRMTEQRIVIFNNDKRTKAEHPTLRGNVCYDNKLYYISLWSKIAKKDDGDLKYYQGRAELAGTQGGNNNIVLFENKERKTMNEPVLTGTIDITGIAFNIALFAKKTIRNDKDYHYWEGRIAQKPLVNDEVVLPDFDVAQASVQVEPDIDITQVSVQSEK